jgi:outer membrane protein assembly factor BamB
VLGDLVVVLVGGPKCVVALDRKSGNEVWTALKDDAGYSSPILATFGEVQQLVVLTGQQIAGLQPETGMVLWKRPWSTSYNVNAATPIVAGDYVFISSDYGKGSGVFKILGDRDSGFRADPVYSFREKGMRNHHASSVLVDGFLYGAHGGDQMRCVDFRTGEARWTTRDMGRGCVIHADKRLIVLGESGELFLVEPNADQFTLRGSFKPFKESAGDNWALPVLSRGLLYVRNHKEIVCLHVTKRD